MLTNTEYSNFGDLKNNFDFTNSYVVKAVNSSGATCDGFIVKSFGKLIFEKRLKHQFLDNPLYISAFRKEFEICQNLEHPNLVRYLNFDANRVCIQTDYIDGKTLVDFIDENKSYFSNWKNLYKFITELCNVLSYISKHQILHLDIKPENIMITTIGNTLKLIDFGCAYSDCFNDTIGKTDSFASPEQFSTCLNIDQRSDIYSIGKILEYIKSKSNTIENINIINKIIKRCLCINAEKRYKQANDVIENINKQLKLKQMIIIGPIVILILIVTVGSYLFSKQEINNNTKSIYKNTDVIISTEETNNYDIIKNFDTYYEESLVSHEETNICKFAHNITLSEYKKFMSLYNSDDEESIENLSVDFNNWITKHSFYLLNELKQKYPNSDETLINLVSSKETSLILETFQNDISQMILKKQ